MPHVDHIKKFVADLRADRELAGLADDIERGLQEADLAADGNDHLAAFFAALEWIVAQPRTAREKLDVMIKLVTLKERYVHIPSMRAFAGW